MLTAGLKFRIISLTSCFHYSQRECRELAVNMQVSYRYRHLPGLYRTCRIPFANTGLVPFQYLHADTYNLQANVFWHSTVLLSACRYLFLTSKYLLAQYNLDTGTPIHPHVTGKYLLAWNRFAISIPVPTS